MVEKISVAIGLEGGDELERQLAAIGAAGQQAFQDISKAASQFGGLQNLKPEQVTAKLKEMGTVGSAEIRKIQAALNTAIRTEQMVGALQKIEQGLENVGKATTRFGNRLIRSFGPIGEFARALGPIGIGLSTVGLLMGKVAFAAFNAAKAISAIDVAAIKAGMSIEKFDTLRQGFEKMGFTAKDVTTAMEGIAKAADKAALASVATALKQIQDMMAFGVGPTGSAQLQLLVNLAGQVGPAADKAREALEKLGLTVILPPDAPQSLSDMITKLGDVSKGTVAFVEQLRKMPDSANRSALAIDAFQDAGAKLVQALRNGLITEDQFKERLGTISQTSANTANTVVQSTNQMTTAWERWKQATAAPGIVEIWDSITAAIDKAWKALMRFVEAGSGGRPLPAAAGAPGHAQGGLLGGRGTGTSDSNLAWVSRGEHIMPAHAVRQPGVLSFLEALRRSGGDLSRVMDRMGHFAMGGLVGLPAFADGGVTGMSHVTIQFPGMPAVAGLRASSGVVEELRRQAAMAQVRSGGRKPSRYT